MAPGDDGDGAGETLGAIDGTGSGPAGAVAWARTDTEDATRTEMASIVVAAVCMCSPGSARKAYGAARPPSRFTHCMLENARASGGRHRCKGARRATEAGQPVGAAKARRGRLPFEGGRKVSSGASRLAPLIGLTHTP